MKKFALIIFFTVLAFLSTARSALAVQFDVLVLPTDIFSVCDNYFCFPEPSEIAANYVIKNLDKYKTINTVELSTIREKLNRNPELKTATEDMLKTFEQTEKIDFQTLQTISKEFGVKSVIIISCYAITDRSATRRGLWEVLEISSAFKITYPFNLTTTAVLTDTINNVVMWSSKYNKTVSDSNGYFLALTQAQAASHLERIKQYFKNNVAQNISQNVHLRFFPKEVRTFNTKPTTQNSNEVQEKQFIPNALENLSKPKIIQEIDEAQSNTASPEDDFIFEF